MNYQANIKKTYSVDLDGFYYINGAIALLESGAQLEIEKPQELSYNYDEQLAYYVNYVHRQLTQDEVVMLFVETPDNFTLACSTKVDYVVMDYGATASVKSAYSKRQDGSYYEIGDGTTLYSP